MWQSFNIWLLLAALLYFTVGGEAWQARGFFHNDENPGLCNYKNLITLSPGETKKLPDACAEISCEDEDGSATINGCGAVAPPDGCEWTGYYDQSTTFQKCCAQNMKCADGLTEERLKQQQAIWSMFSPDLKVPGLGGHGGAGCSKKHE